MREIGILSHDYDKNKFTTTILNSSFETLFSRPFSLPETGLLWAGNFFDDMDGNGWGEVLVSIDGNPTVGGKLGNLGLLDVKTGELILTLFVSEYLLYVSSLPDSNNDGLPELAFGQGDLEYDPQALPSTELHILHSPLDQYDLTIEPRNETFVVQTANIVEPVSGPIQITLNNNGTEAVEFYGPGFETSTGNRYLFSPPQKPDLSPIPGGASRTFEFHIWSDLPTEVGAHLTLFTTYPKQFATTLPVRILFDRPHMTPINESPAGQSFGSSMVRVEDISGDGLNDFAVGTQFVSRTGEFKKDQVSVFDGQSKDLLLTIPSPAKFKSGFGFSLADVPDLVSGGSRGILVGVPGDFVEGNRCGAAYLYDREGELVHKLIPPVPNAPETGLRPGFGVDARDFGYTVAALGDLNSDGVRELAVADPFYTKGTPNQDHEGAVHIFDGRDGSLFTSVSSPSPGTNSYFGHILRSFEDLDDDNHEDFVVATLNQLFLYSGRTREMLYAFDTVDGAGDLRTPLCVDVFSDVDGDGINELLIGLDDGKFTSHQWPVIVRSGRNGQPIPGHYQSLWTRERSLGRSVAGIPDLNGDGVKEIGVGWFFSYSFRFYVEAGNARLYDGRTGILLESYRDPDASGELGSSFIGLEDTNGDGLGEFVIGAQSADGNISPTFAGRVYYYSSPHPGIYMHDHPVAQTFTLQHQWFREQQKGPGRVFQAFDLNGDGRVNSVDLLQLLEDMN